MQTPIDFTLPSALILIDNQSAFSHPSTISHWGISGSDHLYYYKLNVKLLLSTIRAARKISSTPPEIIHIFHSSTTPGSPLHPNHPDQGIRPLDFATPAADGSEPVFWKSVNSAFIGTQLEAYLREKGIRQVLFAGLTTDHCVSTTVRVAANLGVVNRQVKGESVKVKSDGTHENEVAVEEGRIILVADATATFGKGGFDAETVHKVSVASLDGEFADVFRTLQVVKAVEDYWITPACSSSRPSEGSEGPALNRSD